MTLSEFKELLEKVGIPLAYREFDEVEQETLEPPFMAYYQESEDVFYADGTRYYVKLDVSVELYTRDKDPELEEKLESLLSKNKLGFTKNEHYWGDEHLYEVLYELTI